MARPLPALSTATGPLGLGAASLGAAGAVAATAEGSQALYWNPAGLAVPGWDLGYALADGGPAGSLEQGLAVAGSLDQGLGLGLLVQDQRLGGGLDDRETDLGLGAAIQLAPGLSLGTLQKVWTADPGGLTGWSMDLGLAGDLPLGNAGRLRLGAEGVDLASALAWSNGALEDQPGLLRWGLAYEPWPGDWLSFQQDSLDRDGLGAQQQWRLGLQAVVTPAWNLRLGATGGDGLPSLGSAGLGWSPWFERGRLSVDYAVLWPWQPAPGAAAVRQLLDLAWRFGPRPHGVASLAAGTLLRDGQGRLYLVRLFLRPAEPDSRSWTLTLASEGRTLKRIDGAGPLPDSVDWDGRGLDGGAAKASALDWHLVVHNPAGATDSAGHLDLAGTAPPPAAPLARPRVELKGQDQLLVSQADFDVAGVAGAGQASAWELRIVDAGGQAVRSIHGSGPVPKAVHWEGTDDLGKPAEVSLGATYELRVVDAGGRERVALAAPVVDPGAFAHLASDARLEAGAWPSALAVPRPRVIQCSFGFSRGSADLEPQALKVLALAVKKAQAWGLDHCSAEGHADSEGSDELNQRLSTERAAAVLQALARAGLAVPAPRMKSFGDKAPAAGNDTAAGRAQNRRVELKLWGRPSGAGQGPLEGQDP
ncbi:MAG TPA: OmpA family protein [bacterium]|nr:OmpA family protein [bacterium]